MKTNNLVYIGRVLKDGHLSLDEDVKQNLQLKEGDELEISIKKSEVEAGIVSDEKISPAATDYVNYLIDSGVTGETLKRIIQEIQKIDMKFQTMPRSELIKEAFAIAEKRAKAWYQKQGLKAGQLSEDELLDRINRLRNSD